MATLVGSGVRDVVLAPGSRSAPFAYALAAAAEAGWLTVHVRVDERVAGFTALGLARVRPAAVVTTSGTAVANLHPAIAEAAHSHLPLLAVTADRPAELRGVGANQTTVQPGMFAPLTRLDVDLPAGLGGRALAQQVVRAVACARGVGAPGGPVHLNVALRDPLVPGDSWIPGPAPAPAIEVTGRGGEPSGGHHLRRGPRTVVLAGDGAGIAAAHFAEGAGLPLLAEPSSGARAGATALQYRPVLTGELGDRIDRVVVFGRPTLSRPVSALLARTGVEVVVVASRPGWPDTSGSASVVTPAVTADPPDEATRAWLGAWRAAADRARRAGRPGDRPGDLLGDRPTGAAVLDRCLRPGAPTTMLGASMTIRHADVHAPAGEEYTDSGVHANRGLAGIDGTISTATGLALGLDRPVRVVLGDLSFAHDAGGLALGPDEIEADLQVLVLNDGGGTIFSTLEHAAAPDPVLRRFFTTPLRLDLEALAHGYGADYRRVDSMAELDRELAHEIRGRRVVEIPLT
ncbi:2-succinyl-5-enolpyruvyl-6-hydroxy-3-cyclohexene-1-carboxylic-acid synthase [Pseudactinotalea sp. HY160]|nr:2-succinyl-5-enolpyruvyl-6-hydroxy-3-cyclohexene-1-carboxylic-acid synthase [Pseudactinotalea sp. HY160]QGH71118.1 2-succinyl-5-enolpyruvyl-6-hydroxy-3-cyclohexene-1-carboxylic-acid synthase [Pseudactinotalea sp. HY158]